MTSFRMAHTEYTVADFVGRWARKELVINRDYQRSPEVWPTAARSFLVETIMLGYPMPKMVLREKTDLKMRATFAEIVDGQQRTMAIVDYYDGLFRLSLNSEVDDGAGLTFDQLSEDLQERFLQYRLSADVLVGATDDQIIELFRRINSYSVSLNPEEKRHASYQGPMKWLLYHLTRQLDPAFRRIGVFNDKAFARMQDAKILAEIIYSYLIELKTIKQQQLDRLYADYDERFSEADEIERLVLDSVLFIDSMEEIRRSALTKPHNFYALCLAVMHAKRTGSESLVAAVGRGGQGTKKAADAQRELLKLLTVLESDEAPRGRFGDLWRATKEGVNTRERRASRFEFFFQAVSV